MPVFDSNFTVAVTGLNATDNPGPGMGVIRALRAAPEFQGRIVGLAYDSLEPGIYADELVDDVFLIPYPSQGVQALEERLRYIHDKVPLSAVLPTLDTELPAFAALEGVLQELGICSFLPSEDQFAMRSKAHLEDIGRKIDIAVPKTRIVGAPSELYDMHEEMPFPLVIKGAYYGAKIVHTVSEALAAYHHVVAKWGLPVLAQAMVKGDEIDVLAVGDGRGGLVGAVPMRKTSLTDKGKGWAGVTVKGPELMAIAERFMAETEWRGACEIEIIRGEDGEPHLLEINPRFPAWCYLSAGAGMNLPFMMLQLCVGHRVAPQRDYKVGTMFVRISTDQIADMKDFEALVTSGEILRPKEASHD